MRVLVSGFKSIYESIHYDLYTMHNDYYADCVIMVRMPRSIYLFLDYITVQRLNKHGRTSSVC